MSQVNLGAQPQFPHCVQTDNTFKQLYMTVDYMSKIKMGYCIAWSVAMGSVQNTPIKHLDKESVVVGRFYYL